jgi:serine/threonine protein kinase
VDLGKAKDLEVRLRGKKIGSWVIEEYINHGKSAVVFRGVGDDGPVAVKIFDDELIARYGDKTQFARIERELELVGQRHPNLVQILGGGIDPVSQNHFIAMEFLSGPNLKECLLEVSAHEIPALMSQLASAAHFLEDFRFVHRDIKPENIVLLDNFKKVVLLDLGVLRPITGSDITDAEGIQAFVGTLQYSSPEFLLRQEEDSPDGWRALTFYQIGGVLHDLIMRRPLFTEFANPYARLVNAVQFVTPEIQNSAVPPYLVELARCCLLKNWRTRLMLLDWASFKVPATASGGGQSAKQRVTNRGVLAQARQTEIAATIPQADPFAGQRLMKEAIQYLSASARTIRAENTSLPPLKILPKTPNDNGFAIQFRRAPQFGLERETTIALTVEIIDAAARVIALLACCCIGTFSSEGCLQASSVTIFKGTFEVGAVFAALESSVYDFIDQAQLYPAGSSDIFWLTPRSEV